MLSLFVRDLVLFSRDLTEEQARRIEPWLYCLVLGIVIDSLRRVGLAPWGTVSPSPTPLADRPMPAAPLLSDAEIASRLAALPDWRLTDGRLTRSVTTRDFRSALELLTRIADPADEQNHHPGVAIHWNVVTLTLWTHASGGVTERDFRLADAIERILSSPAG